MAVRIVKNSPHLCEFLAPLISVLSCPQQRHLIDLCDGLLVCETEKTLAALRRQFLEATDVSNWADFLRISPWQADSLRVELRSSQVAFAIAQAEAANAAKEIYEVVLFQRTAEWQSF